MQNEPERLSIGKAAKYLGVSVDSLRRWDKKGFITSHKSPGGHRYFIKSDLNSVNHKKMRATSQEDQVASVSPSPIVSSSKVDVSPQPIKPKHKVHPLVITSFAVFIVIDIVLAVIYILTTHS